MSTYSLTGSGTQALSAGTGALRVTVTTLPALAGFGRANPLNYYDIGLLRQGDGTSWWHAEAIDAVYQLVPLLQGTTEIGYALLHGAHIDVTEVIGTSPFYQPLPPAVSADLLLLDSVELGAANAEISLSAAGGAGYSHLRILAGLAATLAGGNATIQVYLRINADATNLSVGACNSADIPHRYSPFDITVFDFLKTDRWKAIMGLCFNDAGSSGNFWNPDGSNWNSDAAVTSLKLHIASSTFIAGSHARLYAVR